LKDRFALNKKNILITGGAGFLAKFHIDALVEKKANIILIDKDLKKLKLQKKKFSSYKKISIFQCDITNKKKLLIIYKKIIQEFKKIDVLINNAFNDHKVDKNKIKKNLKSAFAYLNEDVEVGLIGTLNCIEIFSQSMLKNKDGIIVNIGSDLGIISPNQNLYDHLGMIKPVSYSTTKHGLVGVTKYFSTLWAKKGIRVNLLSPGAIKLNQDKFFLKKINKLIPMGRMCEPEELKEILQYLCSDASSYMTGQNIILDGGRSVW
jgi:NAD(P)-dependent dehydrogenase (short-subunit alcohol dehydrogenase family)